MSQLKKQMGFWGVFSVAAGAMISSGLFILPAIACSKAGPGLVLSYLFASILILPSALSKAELATAMPKAGGTYFFIERSLGSMWGLYGGLAGWFSLALKSAFAVVGIAILIEVILQSIVPIELSDWHLKVIASLFCLGFTVLNVVSVKHTSRFQVLLVFFLLLILALYVGFGGREFSSSNYAGVLDKGWLSIFATAGLVFVSFGGLTKVASIAEDVKDPGRILARGMISAWVVVTIFYIAVVAVTVGLFGSDRLSASSMPLSEAAATFSGPAGFVLLSLAAAAAFVTTANGGLLAASRSPMAMSRDRLLPPILARVNSRFRTPHLSIVLTGGFMILSIILLDLESLVKTASTLMIILFMLDNASVIIMRESRIQSYRPKFKSPLYPYMHIIIIIIYGGLIVDMGKLPLIISVVFFGVSAGWYFLYVQRRVSRASAAMHIVERVTAVDLKTVTLEDELRDILIERDKIIEDRFDKLIRQCEILDIRKKQSSEQVFREISRILEPRLDINHYVLFEKFLERESQGATIVQPGLAIPHIIVDGEDKFDVLPVRSRAGIEFPGATEPVKVMFVLAGSGDQRNYHLRALMAIAQIAQEKHFEQRWLAARNADAIRNLILLSSRKRDTGK